ncbi:hypothetical protein AGMMS49936_08670 [Endomicrobiia bacterium]|nr:hypothetical protein AGMMS49936_08670 [Endomicrobiia bacterium]
MIFDNVTGAHRAMVLVLWRVGFELMDMANKALDGFKYKVNVYGVLVRVNNEQSI